MVLMGMDNRFVLLFFLCKQKTAYEMRISDWSSDVCSSDLGWRFTASIVVPDLLLGPGDYYLSIYDPQATESMLWTLAPTLDGSGFLTFLEHPDSHTLWDGYDLAFRIIGRTTTAIAVPEPATVLPFLFGPAGIGLLPRRNTKRERKSVV